MARKPQKPQKGQPAIKELYNSVCDIIDYLPSLEVTGDQKSTYVTKSSAGTVIHAKQPNTSTQGGKTYEAGSGLTLSGNVFNNAVTSGRFIEVTSAYAINCTLSGGRDIQITQGGIINYTGEGGGGASGYTYTGDGDLGSGHIFVDYSYTNPVICSNLYWISDLNNLPFVQSASIVMPNSLTACNNTVDISQVGQIYNNHFIQTKDILNDGVGTKVNLTWIRNPFGDISPDGTNGIVQGLQVDLTLSGGRYTDVILHKHVYGAYDPDTGTRYDPPTESRVDCLLTGTYDHYPHTSGFIDIVPTIMEDGKTWGVISTNLHAGSGIAIDPQTGEISCTGGGGGTTVIASGVGYPDNSLLYPDNYPAVSGIGISWLIPVSAGVEYRFYTDATGGEDEEENTIQVAYGKFAPSVGETGTVSSLTNGNDFIPDSNGWVRISVFDNGRNEGSCLRFYVNDEDGQYATPLYRFHGFTNYQAGAGIAINSGIISCMLQTNAGLSGLTSTALTTNTYPPVTTGIAIGLSTAWAEDLAKINEHTLIANQNKVLSSNNYGNLVWADNVQIPPPVGADFKVPDFAKLQVTNDAGEEALGLGNTFIIPVSGGSTVRYSADGGTIIARWAPVKGSSKTAFEVTTTNKTTTDDGYVRISVIDPGTLDYGCLRLYVDNKDIPLHKFAKFNYSSGAIYEAGRYMQIQTTSTTVNPQTEQEEPYTLDNPIIHNMLTGGNHITIQQTEMVGGVEQQLKYPRINCDLSEGTNIQITTGGVINCTLSGDNSTVFINDGVISAKAQESQWRSLTPSLLSVDNNNHTLSAATQSGGGGGGGVGGAWPMWENMCGSGHLVYTEQWYTTSTGGWLRLSNRNGGSYHGCNSIYIDPVVPAEGVEGQNHIGLGNAMVSFFLPVPPGSSFWIGMPDDAECWFDGTTSPATHTSTDHAAMNELKSQAESARDVFNSASSNFGNASDNFNSASSYWESYYPDNLDESDKDSFYNWWNEISGYADSLTSQVEELEWWQDTIETTYEGMSTNEGLKYVTSAQTFYLSASAWATSAVNWAVQAKYYYDNCPT